MSAYGRYAATYKKRSGNKDQYSNKKSPQRDLEARRPLVPQADPALSEVFSLIGLPEPLPFKPDPFQLDALKAIQETDCLVTAPTGAGKTWIAEKAIGLIHAKGGRCWYASPLKALTNSKRTEFGDIFGQDKVGILTGDTKENADAPIIVGTTEILRNKLYEAMYRGEDLDYDLVVLDEAHFLGDEDRGVVWEEIMIYLPVRIHMLMLSATIGNNREVAGWLSSLRKKECVVIEDTQRPVPLYPLFLEPPGKITPLLNGNNLHKAPLNWIAKNRTSRYLKRKLLPFDTIMDVMSAFDLLPAIFFLKSRGECDSAVNFCNRPSNRGKYNFFQEDLGEVLERHPHLKNHKQLSTLQYSRVGAHHGGQLPAWKSLIETMMNKGHMDVVFATSTVAAGVNFPARTVVLFNSDQFNGQEFIPLNPTAFHQMTGRAGRRGKDNIGFMLAFPGSFMDLEHIRKVFSAKPEEIKSRIRSDFSMVLNLLLSHTPEDIRDIFEKSFADYQHSQTRGKTNLWNDFKRHLDFLKAEGFVDPENRLTDDGMWTSQLRLDQPLMIAQCLRSKALPNDNEALLAAIMATFVYDRNSTNYVARSSLPKKLRKAYDRVSGSTAPMTKRMKEAGFETSPLQLWVAAAIYGWAAGADWGKVIQRSNMAEGDLAMLISRTADSLHQIASLRESHPLESALAAAARKTILREPVVFD